MPPPDLATRWHALPPDEVLERLGSRVTGLTATEAADRLARYGPNLFRKSPPASLTRILWAQVRSVIVLLLAIAAVVALLSSDPLDAAAIGAVLVLNVAIGFTTELRAHRSMEALLGLEVTRARVLRDGHTREVDARELVTGDVVVLEAGAAVPADARLLEVTELRTMEAPLTGESLPVDKAAHVTVEPDAAIPDRVTMVYKTTAAVAGRGRAVVTGTGMDTEVGRIGTLTTGVQEAPTPLEQRLDTLGRRLAAVALAVAALVAGLGLMQGVPLHELLQTAIALAVAAVPEGLPVVGTIAMAVGVRRMARRKALIRHLPVVEALGSATVICTDKTGTLTAGEMTLTVLRLADRDLTLPQTEFSPDPEVAFALRVAALANRGELVQEGDTWRATGDPTEAALLVAARRAGLEPDALQAEWPEVAEIPFSSARMYMATWHRTAEGFVACVKGAPGRILELSDHVLTGGEPRPLTPGERERLSELNDTLAAQGLRVLGLAYRTTATASELEPRHLTWIGLAGMMDPPAQGVLETIRQFREAGIRTVMVTGDQRLTAANIARQLGLLGAEQGVHEGREVERLSAAALREAVARTGVFSRVGPETKLRIIEAYRERGEVVAMLGDGVNDAAALRKADIGVAMGRRGTDLAKEAADLILADDRFPTIGAAIEQGRITFDNIRKFVFYLFSCNLGEILVVLGASLAGFPSPLLPLQILWLNLLTDTFPALALAVEPGEADVMRQAPRDPRAAILSRSMVVEIVTYGALIAACALAAFAWGMLGPGGGREHASTLTFITLALAQIFHLGNARSVRPVTAWRRITSNPYALGAVALALGLQVTAVHYAPLTRLLGVHAPDMRDWGVAFALGLVPAVAGQVAKALARRGES